MSTGRYHWSNCALPAKFFIINAVASVPWLLLILFPAWGTLIFAVLLTAILVYIEVVMKMTLGAFVRAVTVFLTGRVKATRSVFDEVRR